MMQTLAILVAIVIRHALYLCEPSASSYRRLKIQQHKTHTTGDGFFAECPRLCRVLFIRHLVKRLFAECQRESTRQTTGTRQRGGLPSNNTRQRPGLLSVRHLANQSTRQRAAAVNGRQPPLTLCRVSSPDTRQRGSFASANHIFFYF